MTEPMLLPDLGNGGVTVDRLSPEDRCSVEDLCRRATDFFELVEGKPASEETARDLLETKPPGFESAGKFLFGFRRGGRLIGVVDLIEGYPADGEWWVGLLLLDPDERRRRLGRVIWTELESWITRMGGRAVGLVVQDQNNGAQRFWESCGFTVDGEVRQALPKITNRVWRMRKELHTLR